MKRIYKLISAEVKRQCCAEIMRAELGHVVRISEADRTLDQNSMFHGICGKLEKSGIKWAGKPRKLSEWKVLLISGHAMATDLPSEVVAGLEGEFVAIRESSADMSKKRKSSLIEYSLAFGVSNGVEVYADA